MKTDSIIKLEPYSMRSNEKNQIFLECIQKSVQFHYKNCNQYRDFCIKRKFDPFEKCSIESIPFLPVSIFKKLELLSVPKNEIIRTIHSSSTSGNLPSIINLDKITTRRQIITLNSILKNYLGDEKLSFLIFDHDSTVNTVDLELSSRGSAIRGMLGFSKDFFFLLNDDLEPDLQKITDALNIIDKKKTCIFGFTWLIYKILTKNKNEEMKKLFQTLDNPFIIHIGGWKKLTDESVDKITFNNMVSRFFNTKSENVVDFYGMTEQLGVVYPDCSEGNKHVPIFADVLIRDIHNQQILPHRTPGFIQTLCPTPNSYPGISVLTDDIGEVLGEDDCPCGRKGKYFVFKKRSEVAEPKGCGDTLAI